MNDLIERLEKATGPDRNLDADIASSVGWSPGPGYTRKSDDSWRLGNWINSVQWAPLYTASIDAALTLVPEGHDWIVADVNGHVGGTPYACVGSTKEHFGETAVLSLCIAALKARSALVPKQHQGSNE